MSACGSVHGQPASGRITRASTASVTIAGEKTILTRRYVYSSAYSSDPDYGAMWARLAPPAMLVPADERTRRILADATRLPSSLPVRRAEWPPGVSGVPGEASG